MDAPLPPFEIFYSYADEDEAFLAALEQHLSLLHREGLTTSWHKRRIPPGADWQELLDQRLHTADVILLLVSPAFLASDYCYGNEMQQAMLRQQTGHVCVIPLLLRPADWQCAPFGRLRALPYNQKPVTSWSNQDEAFLDIALGIRTILTDVHKGMSNLPKEKTDVSLILEAVNTPLLRGHKGLSISSTLKERFEGAAGRRVLKEALKMQKMVAGHGPLAEAVTDLIELREVRAGEAIIQQGAADNDIFFILVGSFSILVNGKAIAKRGTHDHVGEMSAIEPAQPRSATVIANEDSVIGRLSEAQLADLGQRYGAIWRYFARELVRRLAQRNVLVTPL